MQVTKFGTLTIKLNNQLSIDGFNFEYDRIVGSAEVDQAIAVLECIINDLTKRKSDLMLTNKGMI